MMGENNESELWGNPSLIGGGWNRYILTVSCRSTSIIEGSFAGSD
jgi:hypothetical protein